MMHGNAILFQFFVVVCFKKLSTVKKNKKTKKVYLSAAKLCCPPVGVVTCLLLGEKQLKFFISI